MRALLVPLFLLAPLAARAEDEQKARSIGPPKLEAIERGFFVEAGVGGGYTLVQQNVPDDDPNFLTLRGKPEGLGAGASMRLAIGIDLAEALAFQVVGGNTLIAGTRTDRVRDVGLMYGGAGVRLSLPAGGDRVRFIIGGAGVYVRSDDGVKDAEMGPGAYANFGIEYFANVRHFSIGLDVNVLMPFAPSRVFVGVGPQLKYTF